MKTQGSAQIPTPTGTPPDSEPVVLRPPRLLCLLGIVDIVILLVGTWGLMAESNCDPEMSQSPARCLPFLLFMGTFIGFFALGTIYLYRYRLIVSPESITECGLWKPTAIRADQVTRLQWITTVRVVVHSENAKITITAMNASDKHRILSLLNKYYADKPQDGLEAAIAREEQAKPWKDLRVSILVPLILIGLFIAGLIAAYIAYQTTIALVMAILGVPPLIYVIWSEIRHRKKAAEQNQSTPNQPDA
jgi:hypothetical protein